MQEGSSHIAKEDAMVLVNQITGKPISEKDYSVIFIDAESKLPMDFMDKDQFYKFVCELYLRQAKDK